jgi:TetR/AcrR family transcriptional regulator, transcriptional repressor for nem operon
MRSKTFDTDEALLAALSVFWERGFESTNMPELLEQMSVGRASFYNAFDSKRDVFLKSLDLYFANVDSHLAALVANTETSEQAVATLVDGILEVAKNARTGGSGWRGCFLGNTALELGANDREIADRLRIGIEVLKAQFKRALALPSAAGKKRRASEIDALALHLVANIQGLLVLAKSGLAEADIKTARTTLLATLT